MAQQEAPPTHAGPEPWAAIRALFPPAVHSEFSAPKHEAPPLYEEEARGVVHAVPARQREFAIGRACARAALARFGVAATAIPVGERRAPVWPAGFVGSITHCAGFVGAVVARIDQVEAIGFDVEPAIPLEAGLLATVCTEAEIRWLRTAPPLAAADWGTVIFSAKEAIHKCVAPRSGVTLGFREVELTLRPADGTFSASLLAAGYPTLPDLARLIGRFAIGPAFVSTAAIVVVPG